MSDEQIWGEPVPPQPNGDAIAQADWAYRSQQIPAPAEPSPQIIITDDLCGGVCITNERYDTVE